MQSVCSSRPGRSKLAVKLVCLVIYNSLWAERHYCWTNVYFQTVAAAVAVRTVLLSLHLCFQALMLGLSMCAMIHEQLLSATKAAVKSLRFEVVPIGKWRAL